MTVKHFVDTNILVYAASQNPINRQKTIRARELIAATEFGLSAQVLAEFYVIVTQKEKPPLASSDAFVWIEQFRELPCIVLDPALVMRGIEFSVRHRISYWDGAILAAAEALGATTLYSEDLSHRQQYGTVQVINPFLPA